MKTKFTLLGVFLILGAVTATIAQPLKLQSVTKLPGQISTSNHENRFLRTMAIDSDLTVIKTNLISNCGYGSAEEVKIVVRNSGTTPIANIPVGYKVGNNPEVLDIITDSVRAGTDYTFVFNVKANFDTLKTYNLKLFTAFAGDKDKTNDTLLTSFTHSTTAYLDQSSIKTGFEPAEPFVFTLFDQNDQFTWTFDGQQPRTGTRYLTNIFDNRSPRNDDWFFTPCLFLDTGVNYELKFYYKGNTAGAGIRCNLEVMLGSMADTSAMERSIFKVEDFQGSTYREALVTFSVQKPGGYVMGFHDYSSANQISALSLSVGIDDLILRKIRSKSAGVLSLISPKTACDISREPVSVLVVNNGLEPISNFTVTVFIPNRDTVVQNVAGPIAVGEEFVVNFDDSLRMTTGTTFNVFATTSLSLTGEGVRTQVKEILPQSVSASTSYKIDFEGDAEPDGWDKLDVNGDGKFWFRQVIRGADQIDPSSARALTYPGFEPASVDGDDWYFSRCINFNKNNGYILTFFRKILVAQGSDVTPSFEIYVGNSPVPDSMKLIGSFTEPNLDDSYIDTTNDRINFPSGSYYFGFYTNAPAGSGRVLVDNFEVSLDPNYVSISEMDEFSNSIIVYPNPSTDFINVGTSFIEPTNITVEVFDIIGKEVLTNNFKGMLLGNAKLDVSKLNEGVYTVRVSSGSLFTTKKLVVSK